MIQSNDNSMYTAKILLLAVIFALVGYFITVKKTSPNTLKESISDTTVNKSSDLDQAQDQLDSINIDSVDSGLNQLNSDSTTF